MRICRFEKKNLPVSLVWGLLKTVTSKKSIEFFSTLAFFLLCFIYQFAYWWLSPLCCCPLCFSLILLSSNLSHPWLFSMMLFDRVFDVSALSMMRVSLGFFLLTHVHVPLFVSVLIGIRLWLFIICCRYLSFGLSFCCVLSLSISFLRRNPLWVGLVHLVITDQPHGSCLVVCFVVNMFCCSVNSFDYARELTE